MSPVSPEGQTESHAEHDAPRLSLAVTVTCFNNEATIVRTLDSVRGLAGAIVCVDSGSTDRTVEICRERDATVIHQPFLGYVKQKQFALDEAAKLGLDWTLHLDSDESLEPALQQSLREAIESPGDAGGYEINRKVFYLGRMLEHAWQPEWRLRLVRTGQARWTGYDPHDKMELIDPDAAIGQLRGDCRHDSIESMASFLARQVSHARIAAESYHAMGRRGRPRKLLTSPAAAFFKMLVRGKAYRDGWRGWCAAGSAAAATLMKQIVLLELSEQGDDGESGP